MELSHFLYVFCEISAYSVGIPIILSFFYFNRSNRTIRILFYFLYLSAILDLITIILANYKQNNALIAHLDTLSQVIFLGLFYYYSLKIKFIRKSLILITICLALFTIINGIFIQGLDHFNSYSRTAVNIFLIFPPLLYFYELFVMDKIVKIEMESMFWISIGTLIYYTGTLFVFILYMNSNFGLSKEINIQIWVVNSFLNILQNILFGVAILCLKKI